MKKSRIQEPKLFEITNELSKDKSDHSLKYVFREIRDYFAGNVTGITRDEQIAQNLMRIIFCKLYTELKGDSKNALLVAKSDEIKLHIDNLFN
jgi:type I restriction enzyme M protein